jgi:hypothetical protein
MNADEIIRDLYGYEDTETVMQIVIELQDEALTPHGKQLLAELQRYKHDRLVSESIKRNSGAWD